MTTQPDHHSSELIPRPERTPDALRVAVAKIAPHRLREMEKQKNEAFAMAAQLNSVKPIHGWLLMWAQQVEIERRPNLSARLRTAEALAQTLDREDPRWRSAMDTIHAVLEESLAAMRE
jgi:hypothetical protein